MTKKGGSCEHGVGTSPARRSPILSNHRSLFVGSASFVGEKKRQLFFSSSANCVFKGSRHSRRVPFYLSNDVAEPFIFVVVVVTETCYVYEVPYSFKVKTSVQTRLRCTGIYMRCHKENNAVSQRQCLTHLFVARPGLR